MRRIGGRITLALEVVATYARVRLRFRDRDLLGTLADVRDAPAAAHPAPTELDGVRQGVRLGRVVRRTLPLLPADSRCLMQSLVLVALLARRGVRGELLIGVKPGASFGAHAWVELSGHALLPADDEDFRRLVAL